jgi:Flp pilus assembly CpaF family ATPase
MLNAFTGFFRPDALVITVEDSLELKPNPSKMLGAAMETVPARPDVETDRGVTMRDLVQSATQMRPDIIVLGEVTDGAAWDLCQALNLGRSGGSTYHANSPKAAIPRLLSMIGQAGMVSPEAALPLISSAFDFIVFLGHSLQDGSRRVMSVVEIPSTVDFDQEDKPYLNLRTLWEFTNQRIVDGKITGEWLKVNEISEDLVESRALDIVPDLSWEQIKMLSKIDAEDMEQ